MNMQGELFALQKIKIQLSKLPKAVINSVIKRDGKTTKYDVAKVINTIKRCAQGLLNDIDLDLLLKEVNRNIFENIKTKDLEQALILASSAFIEVDPAYSTLAKNLSLQRIYKEVIGKSINEKEINTIYKKTFIENINKGISLKRLDEKLADFPLEKIAENLKPERDSLLNYMGIHTLYGRYLLKHEQKLIELPQTFLMRVSMGLALLEKDKIKKALEFYEILSTQRYLPSTPTLFHSGTTHPQLSSCYLTYIEDDLNHIFKSLKDQANLSKWSGGIGTDWTSLRATGSRINSINVESQGIIPFLKITNDVVAAISRSGSRRGAACAYLEAWHLDFEDFLDLRRNTGDERRRTHDMNTAAWIPDLFMERVTKDENWTLFCPSDTPNLHDLYGKKFKTAYLNYEKKTTTGEITNFKTIPATQLWRKMLSRLFETGHPWITFKDACNVRSPQDHVGVIHSSNLCTEITLNTSKSETAVCNLGSINLTKHIQDGKLDEEKLSETINHAVRMLDNAIDVNFYPTEEAKNSNFKHRPLGLGIMGFQNALYKLDVPFDSPQTIEIADELMEKISYHAILASSKLAKERGSYKTYPGSKWSKNIFPIDTIELLEKERGQKIEVSKSSKLDWTPVRKHVKKYGMRNSNIMAIAPTATISNIAGSFPSIEPIYKNIYVKANMSGEFTIVNEYLINDLKKLNLWDKDILDKIKYYDGNIQMIEQIPDNIRAKYKEAFDIDSEWLIKLTAARGKWIDQSQSHNVFLKGVSGKKLSDIYITAWKSDLKTCYYLRTMAATQIEKSTLDAKKFGFTQKREYSKVNDKVKACNINDESCDACQ